MYNVPPNIANLLHGDFVLTIYPTGTEEGMSELLSVELARLQDDQYFYPCL